MAAVAGIIAGGVCHLCMSALGVALVLQYWPPLYHIMLLVGAGYIAWMGWQLLRSDSIFHPTPGAAVLGNAVIFRRALTTSLLNPKAYILILAIFPQFLRPADGPLWLQSGVLGATVAARIMGLILIATAVLSASRA